jgi:hypothetical protein
MVDLRFRTDTRNGRHVSICRRDYFTHPTCLTVSQKIEKGKHLKQRQRPRP